MSKIDKKEGNSNAKDQKLQRDSQRSNLIQNIDSLRTKMKKENALLPKASSSNINRGIVAVFIIIIAGSLVFLAYLSIPPTVPQVTLPPGHQSCTSVGGFTCDASANTITSNGKLVFVYVGAEYCPYCAAERWAIVKALGSFGSFGTSLGQTASAPETNIPSINTYTFVNAVYTSSSIAFEPVETENATGYPLQPMSTLQSQLFSTYDTQGSIPFISIGGKYFKIGSGVSIQPLEGLSFSEIQNALNSQSGAVYTAIITESNNIVAVLNTLGISSSTPSTTGNTLFNRTLDLQLLGFIKTDLYHYDYTMVDINRINQLLYQ